MKSFTNLIIFLFLSSTATAQVFTVDTISKTGPLEKRINLVYLADGYTAGEQAKFINDVISINDKLFNTVPIKEYKNYFNVFAIRVISIESGVKHPITASDCPSAATHPQSNPNNYFGTTFDAGNIHRLVVPSSYANINSVLATNFPLYDHAFIVANTSFYGGSGGTVATSTTNTNAAEIMIHEIGHSFARLADEYWAGPQYALEKPNMTAQSSPALVKWKNWTGAPGIGVHQHTGGTGWYKPTTGGTCKMEALGAVFCSVCKETFVERIHELSSPLDSYSPSNATTFNVYSTVGFKLNLLQPVPNTLKVRWLVNTEEKALNTDTFTLLQGSLVNGNYTLLASVADTTQLSRADNHLTIHTTNISWQVSMITGVQEPDVFRASLKIFPNPFSESLMLQYKLERRSAVSVQLISMNGTSTHLIQEKNQPAGSYSIPFTLNKYQLAEGVYTIVFKINGATIAKELIKLQ
ncbi:M64 family metallopeptidase [Lacibacter sp.]|uniref:M64 family metallopeptidase n=1 Tax=Lacibacter sp. TaxID=1915409 RepID=UPI002B4B39EB|nr:M64 family metallopeptidase [Lacibacter sp.]HLP38029.1 M64 family metallopeptidase [Lacibacter sp.]